MRRTKILATVGPATRTSSAIAAALSAGADAFRINLAHGTSADHAEAVRRIRREASRLGREVGVVADVPGPKVRLGTLAPSPLVLRTGQRWTLDRDPTPGDSARVGVELPTLTGVARAGDPALLGDGSVELRVVRPGPRALETVVVHGGPVSSHAGLFLPRARLRTQVLGREDRELAWTVLAEGVDFIALSFVRNARDVRSARSWVDGQTEPGAVGLVSKIERAEAVEGIGPILEASDGIMVARGDLGIELPLERLALEQKRLVREANVAGKFSIVATQMLLSMLSSPRPTRAEATDVANAVLDGADAVMLSEESAVGAYPLEAIRWLARIAEATEPSFDPRSIREAQEPAGADGPEHSVAGAAVHLAEAVRAGAIITPTQSGRTARLVAAFHPACPVLALSHAPGVRRSLALVGGVRAFPAPSHSDLPHLTHEAQRLLPLLDLPTRAVLTAGYPVEGRPTNLLTLIEPSAPVRPSAHPRRG